MKKVLLCLSVISLFSIMLITLAGCGTKYCTVSGCPKESLHGSDYCYQHKCFNQSCSNRSVEDYSYCRECFERAK